MAGVLKDDVKAVGEALGKQKKRAIMIPFDPLNPEEPYIVSINGYITSIPRGQMVEVPEEVFLVAQESMVKTMRVERSIKPQEPKTV